MKYFSLACCSLFLFLIASCGTSPSSNSSEPVAQTPPPAPKAHPMEKVLMMNCYLCHHPASASHDVITAPPLVGTKYHYLQAYPEREDFIEAMVTFLKDSRSDNALMKGAVKRYGPMIQVPADEETLRQIAIYMYDEQLEEPDWFPAHFEEKQGKPWEGQ